MKIYEVMVFVNDNGYDVRCRNDIDSKPGFRRQRDDKGNFTGVIENEIFETGEIRYGYIVYTGPESKAKNFANLIKFGYKGNDTPRYNYVSLSSLIADENVSRTLRKGSVSKIQSMWK
jgi:hypothetical protein